MIHSGTKISQTLNLIRPITLPMNRIGVIAANTNWKYASEVSENRNFGMSPDSSGMTARACSEPAPTIAPGVPTNVWIHGVPKPILNAHSTQATSVRQNVANTMRTVFIAHLRCTRPPYRTARAGMLMRPTRVAAVICHALSPDDSQLE